MSDWRRWPETEQLRDAAALAAGTRLGRQLLAKAARDLRRAATEYKRSRVRVAGTSTAGLFDSE